VRYDLAMTAKLARDRVFAVGWAAAFLISSYLEYGTIVKIRSVGLTGPRAPVPPLQTALHVLMALAALALMLVFRSRLERIMLVTAAAASASTALYGFGGRSDMLSGFRLLSHLAAYALIMVVSVRRVGRLRRRV